MYELFNQRELKCEFYFKMKYYIFYVIILLMTLEVNSFTCFHQEGEDTCPAHRPFCTSVGCVSRCAKSLYINGSSCVLNCGDLFVSDRTCVPFCPEDRIVRKTLKVIADKLYMEKTCVTACYGLESIYNGTCETECPSNANFIVNKHCSEICPAYQPYKINYTIERVLQYKCVKRCQKLSEDYFCTTTCSSGKVVYNSTCVLKCPPSHAYILGQQCVESCPNTTVHIENQLCMSYCPPSLPYVFNGSCVTLCPSESMFYNFQNNLTSCVNDCDRYISNKSCVYKCPSASVLFNKTCLPECPSDFRFVTNVTEKYDCESDYCKTIKWHMQCMEKCPLDTFMDGRNCVTECPSEMVVLNGSCVNGCDDTLPLIENAAIERTIWKYTERQFGWRKEYVWKKITSVNIARCVSNCSAGNLLMKNSSTCLDTCPDSHRVLNNKFCVSKCPDTYRYEIKTNNCTGLGYWNSRCRVILTCIKKCPIGTVTYTNQCLYACPDSMVNLNNATCLFECPESHPFHLETDITVPFPLHKGIVIVKGSNIVEPTTICYDHCPHGYVHDKLKMECVKICPYNASYIYRNICITDCPDGLVKNNTIIGTQCLRNCPQGTVLNPLKSECVKNCPEEIKYIHETVCLNKCPSSHRFGIKAEDFWISKRYICVKSCDGDDVYKNEECIGAYSCKDPEIIFDGQCLLECPSGYLWFMTCFLKLGTIIAIPSVCILLTITVLHMRLFFKDSYQVVRLSAVSHNFSPEQLNEEKHEDLSYENGVAVAAPDDINLEDTDHIFDRHNHGHLGGKSQGNDADIELKEDNNSILLSNIEQNNGTSGLFRKYKHKSVNADILVHYNNTNNTDIDSCDNIQCRANGNTETADNIDNSLSVSNLGFLNDRNETTVEETMV